MANSDTQYHKNYENRKMDNFINVLEKDVKVKKNLSIQYDVNNTILLEDPRFRTLLLTKHWFTLKDNDLYSKIIYNPFLIEKDYEKIQNIKNHHERIIDTFFYISFLAYFLKIKNSFSKRKVKGFAKKSFFFMSFPIIVLSYFSLAKPLYLRYRINDFASQNEDLTKYAKLELDLKLINKELSKYKIRT